MPDDKPIAHTAEGRPIYDNTPTVVSVIVPNLIGEVLAIRRANEPGRGLLGLPGGYHMRGESWQEAGCREVKEEAGIDLDPEFVWFRSLNTDEYGNNLVICSYPKIHDFKPTPVDGEALECVWVSGATINPSEWAFPRHLAAVLHYLGRGSW